jgi:hypothetical protein
MNFLEIAQKVHSLSGLHGSYSDVTSTKQLQKKISEGINETWIALQNLSKKWTFMIRRYQGFTCTQGVETYTTTDVGITDLGVYIKNSFFLDRKPLVYVTPEGFPYIDNTDEDKPLWYTIDPHNNDIYMDLPDTGYDFDIYYRAQVQDMLLSVEDPANPGEYLNVNYNIPELPPNYHHILVYGGLSAFSAFIEDAALYNKWELEYQKGVAELMREYIPSEKIRTRSII